MLSSAALAIALNGIAERPRFAHAIVAAEVYDLDTHRVVYSRNASMLMEAASTTKLLTEGTSLGLLGPNFRWTTPVYRTGPIVDGALHGDLILVASGDPNLSQRIAPNGTMTFENEDHSYDGTYDTKAVPGDPLTVMRQLAAQVRARGIREIDGRIIVDSSLFSDAGPEGGTGAIVSPTVVNDNLIDVTVTPGDHIGDPVTLTVSPQTPYARFIATARTGAKGSEPTIDLSTDHREADGSHTITVTGTMPAGKPILYAYRVPHPSGFAQMAFAIALRDAGVSVDKPADAAPFDHAAASASYVPANLVASHVSPRLAQDVYVTLKVSDNLHASLMPYMWGLYAAHAPTDLLKAGFKQEHAFLTHAGLDLNGAAQQDGLGSFAFFTPRFMVSYLAWAAHEPWFSALFHGLPTLGVDGTLFNIQNGSPAVGKVHAKTGTWGSDNLLDSDGLVTKGLAGYVTSRSGHHYAFAFYINRMAGIQSVDPNKDGAHYAGETLGEMAADVYNDL